MSVVHVLLWEVWYPQNNPKVITWCSGPHIAHEPLLGSFPMTAYEGQLAGPVKTSRASHLAPHLAGLVGVPFNSATARTTSLTTWDEVNGGARRDPQKRPAASEPSSPISCGGWRSGGLWR